MLSNTVSSSNEPVVVFPEIATTIELSSSDINRLICQADVQDVVRSKEKGVLVKKVGKNAFVKFLINKEGDKMVYSTTPTELYVICGGETFNIIALPKRIPARTVILSGGDKKMKKNVSLFKGMPFEAQLLSIIKHIYKEDIPDSFTVKEEDRPLNLYQGLNLTLVRTVRIEGEGLSVKEFVAKATQNIEIEEKNFLKNELTTNPVAIAIDKLKLSQGDVARIIIVERVLSEGGE